MLRPSALPTACKSFLFATTSNANRACSSALNGCVVPVPTEDKDDKDDAEEEKDDDAEDEEEEKDEEPDEDEAKGEDEEEDEVDVDENSKAVLSADDCCDVIDCDTCACSIKDDAEPTSCSISSFVDADEAAEVKSGIKGPSIGVPAGSS